LASNGFKRSFGHNDKSASRVIVLGGGNPMDGAAPDGASAAPVKVIVRSGFEEMKASPREKEDAMHEGTSRSSTSWCRLP